LRLTPSKLKKKCWLFVLCLKFTNYSLYVAKAFYCGFVLFISIFIIWSFHQCVPICWLSYLLLVHTFVDYRRQPIANHNIHLIRSLLKKNEKKNILFLFTCALYIYECICPSKNDGGKCGVLVCNAICR